MEGAKSALSPLPAANPAALHQDSEDDQIRALPGLLQESNFFSFVAEKAVRLFLFPIPLPWLSVTYRGVGRAEQKTSDSYIT